MTNPDTAPGSMKGASVDRILYLLKTRGALTAKQLSEQLQMTPMGARQHLLQLEEQQLVSSFSKAEKVGRPSQYWQLAMLGHQRFGDSHSQLSVNLIDAVRQVFGEQGLEALISQRETDTRKQYLAALEHLESVEQKVTQLADLRSKEGYMAEVQSEQSGDYLLIENHCPICVAAQHCQDFCRSELALFQECFSGTAEVSRDEHLLDGARRCCYRISPR